MQNHYNGFDVISTREISDCEAQGIYLRHRKTGLEVFHVLNADEENLFAFAFRTPARDSTGAAHILEHSVLCGSEKFPLKEPFVNLMNQSVYTFLNAMTYSDKTVYPASSVNKKDYFHLMDVYGDAVFFPLLKEETFLQEAHRLEVDASAGASIQGVVYNEMKGGYSSFNGVAFDEQFKSLLAGTCYVNDSGGDPLAIPTFTYEQFKRFHREHYKPSNCLLFLYGNIPTEEQLNFVQKKLLDRLEKIDSISDDLPRGANLNEQFIKMETPPTINAEIVVNAFGPSADAKESNVTLNWRYGNAADMTSTMEVIFLTQLLAGNDASPVSKALVESNLGDRLIAGASSESFSKMLYFGLSGVKKADAPAVRILIIDTLTELCEKGVSKNDIAAATLAVDFANREVTRLHGEPYALELMERALNGWNYGAEPASTLLYRAAFDKLKTKIEADEHYVKNLIKKILLDNSARSFVTVTPDDNFLKEREIAEKNLIKKLSAEADAKELERATNALHDYQTRVESEEEAACIPHVEPSDLKPYVEPIETRVVSVAGGDGSEVQVFVNQEATNGIVYMDLCFPADNLNPHEYPYIPAFTTCALDTGWNGKNWAECAAEASLCLGDLSVRAAAGVVSTNENAKKAIALAEGKHYIGRDWIIVSAKMPVEKTKDALSLLQEAVLTMNFNDERRIQTLLEEALDEMRSSLIPYGSHFARLRACRALGRNHALEEIWSGLRQILTLQNIVKDDARALGKKFASFAETIQSAGGIVHITADKNSLDEVMPLVPDFVKRLGLHALLPKPLRDDDAFYQLTKFDGEADGERRELCRLSSQVGYAASAAVLGNMTQNEKAANEVLCHWMKGNILWETFRTTGGAYGASATFDSAENVFALSTYRDPTPAKSIETFASCLERSVKSDISKTDIARAITGTYGEITRPLSPASRGGLGFRNTLYAKTEEERNERIQSILATSADALRDAANKMSAMSPKMASSIISDKAAEGAGFIFDVAL